MITYIDTKNREKYQVLFNKAETALRNAATAGTLPAGIDIATLEIATLNQYFAYLKDLITVSSTADIKRYFTRLPLDEDFFEINANTREIKVPATFSRNGVGVQGDEMAEVVYFTIDRYFDSMDLANENINIVIQWEAKDANKQTIVGISPNYGKDIETIPGKIIFGWPIYSELTETAGNIKFAVRFFSLGDPDDQGVRALNYSLATLPAEVSVGATIDYDMINRTVREIDRGSVITGRINNTGIYDPSIPIPGAPVITTPLYVIGKDATVRIVDLPVGGPVRLGTSAVPYDIGAVQYAWKQWAYDTATGEYSNTSTDITTGIDNAYYIEMTGELGDDTYYRITSSEGATPVVYEPIAVSDYLDDEPEYVEDQGYPKADGGYVKLYKKLSVASVNQVGIYTVDVGARYGTNVVPNRMDKVDGIKIPGPLKPVITPPTAGTNISYTEEDHITHVIVPAGETTVSVTAAAGETGKSAEEVGEDPQVVLAYEWKQVVGGEVGAITEETGITYTYNADHSEMTIEGLATSALDKTYLVEVTATRNGISTKEQSGNYRLTNAPIKPVLKYRVFENGEFRQVVKDYTTETSAIAITLTNRAGDYNKIAFSVEPPAFSDNLSYVWMKANIDPEEDSDWDASGAAKLQVDLDNLLPDLFNDITGDPDIAVDGAFGLTTLPTLGEVLPDEDNGPSYQFTAETTPGYYYCIVINEVNNNRVANVSPFFHVTD